MIEASFTVTAIAIGVACWIWRENRRLHSRNVTLELDKVELDRRCKALRSIAGYMGETIKAL